MLSTIKIENVLFIVKIWNKKYNQVFFISVFYIFGFFTNFIFGNKLLKYKYYIYDSNQKTNSYFKNSKIVLAFIQDISFSFKLYKKLKFFK